MPAVARVGDPLSCGDHVAAGSPDVYINGLPVARNTDATTGHAEHPASVLIAEHSTVFVNGLPIAIVGDKNVPHGRKGKHQGAIATGSEDVEA